MTLPVVYLKPEPASWGKELAELCRDHGITHLHAHFGNVSTATAQTNSASLLLKSLIFSPTSLLTIPS
ncbi:MAG: hypothetical protein KDA99_02075 [Planctomycetales bacterium]|nr:hypothetical protein [Planctomycetales bacterium]